MPMNQILTTCGRVLSPTEAAAFCLTVEDVVARTGKSPWWVRELMRHKRIDSVSRGGRLWTSEHALSAYKPKRVGRKAPSDGEKLTKIVRFRLSERDEKLFKAMGGALAVRRQIAAWANEPAVVDMLDEILADEPAVILKGGRQAPPLEHLDPRDNPKSGEYAGPNVLKWSARGVCTMDTRTDEFIRDFNPKNIPRQTVFEDGYDAKGPIPGWSRTAADAPSEPVKGIQLDD
jgi:hypothetical protein